ncbi:MAG TPA: DUF4399 domain-containing protein [Stellaceae bacterium]|nr:DUF4399 domain-containing protein [Stellaceae bacterium]
MSQKLLRRSLLLAAPALAVLAAPALAGPTPAGKDAYLYFITPHNGQKVHSPFLVIFGLRNMGVAPAGVKFPNTGHHHLFIDVTEPLDPNVPIPQDKKHLHFGAGQTQARIELPKGRHTLQLVLGDADHIPFDPPVVSKVIHITVI